MFITAPAIPYTDPDCSPGCHLFHMSVFAPSPPASPSAVSMDLESQITRARTRPWPSTDGSGEAEKAPEETSPLRGVRTAVHDAVTGPWLARAKRMVRKLSVGLGSGRERVV